jgi:hypothetical protein
MALTLAQIMSMDLYKLTDKNHSIGNLFISSAMIQVLEHCKAKGTSPAKVKFHSMNRLADNRFRVHVTYV